jgi:hypothetical protein
MSKAEAKSSKRRRTRSELIGMLAAIAAALAQVLQIIFDQDEDDSTDDPPVMDVTGGTP